MKEGPIRRPWEFKLLGYGSRDNYRQDPKTTKRYFIAAPLRDLLYWILRKVF